MANTHTHAITLTVSSLSRLSFLLTLYTFSQTVSDRHRAPRPLFHPCSSFNHSGVNGVRLSRLKMITQIFASLVPAPTTVNSWRRGTSCWPRLTLYSRA